MVSPSDSTSAELLTSQLVTVMTAVPEYSACSCRAAVLLTAARPERLARMTWLPGQHGANQQATVRPRLPKPPADAGRRSDRLSHSCSARQLRMPRSKKPLSMFKEHAMRPWLLRVSSCSRLRGSWRDTCFCQKLACNEDRAVQ